MFKEGPHRAWQSAGWDGPLPTFRVSRISSYISFIFWISPLVSTLLDKSFDEGAEVLKLAICEATFHLSEGRAHKGFSHHVVVEVVCLFLGELVLAGLTDRDGTFGGDI